MADKYRWHLAMLVGLFILKSLVMKLEQPFEEALGWDATGLVHSIEGDAVLQVQRAFLSEWMTVAMAIVYIGSFLFIYVFSFLLFAYAGKFRTASTLMFIFLVLLVVSIPFYFLMIVRVTSWPFMPGQDGPSYVPGMEALLYNYNGTVNEWFSSYDTFNNCFPSMHVGYPAAILLYICRKQPGFVGYKAFLGIMIVLISLSIVYLGIHWVVDIVGGLLAAFVAVFLAERYAERFWRRAYKLVGRDWSEADWT